MYSEHRGEIFSGTDDAIDLKICNYLPSFVKNIGNYGKN